MKSVGSYVASGAVIAFLCSGTESDGSITLDLVRTQVGFESMAMDPVTGQFYQRSNYNCESGVSVYANAAAFAANTPSTNVVLQGGGFYGTYFAVRSGDLFGRTTNNTTSTAKWDAGTGAKELTDADIPNMGGDNVVHTFNWGGYSGVNWMQDATGLYVFGKDAVGSMWQLNQMDQNLNVISTKTFVDGALGYGFMINGNLFTSASYNSRTVNEVFNFATGTRSTVNFDLDGGQGVGATNYWDNTTYDPTSDTLYLHNEATNRIYKVSDASDQFGVPLTTAVPEPLSVIVWSLLGCIGLAGYVRSVRIRTC